MTESENQAAEVRDALETVDQMHNDISRLKRLGILTNEENLVSKARIEEVSETLENKLPEQ